MSASEKPVSSGAYVWVPDRRWTTEPEIIEGKRCRMRGGGKNCQRAAVAALARSNGWWCYCDRHLYGRRLENGQVEARVSAASPAAERGFTR